MGISAVFVNSGSGNVSSNFLDFSITKELERGTDVATVSFPGNVSVGINNQILILMDAIDLSGLTAIYHFENHLRDESANVVDGNAIAGPQIGHASFVLWDGLTNNFGYSLSLDGSSGASYVDIPNAASNNFTGCGTFSISFKIRFNAINYAQSRGILVQSHQAAAPPSGWAVYIDSSNKINAWFAFTSSQTTTITSTTAFTTGVDYDIVITHDQTLGANRLNMYVNGVLDASATGIASGTVNASAEDLRIGLGTFDFHTAGFNGLIDEVRLYQRALSLYDIQTIHNLVNLTLTMKFGGRVWKIDNAVTPRVVQVKSFGKVIGETTITNQVFNNQTVDSIAQSLIANNTSLFFLQGASTQASPTLQQFIASGQLVDILNALASIGNKTFYTDAIAQFHWDDHSAVALSDIKYTHGTNCSMNITGYDDTQLANSVIVKGQDIQYQYKDNFTGDGVTTTFTTTYNLSNVLVTIDGITKTPNTDYSINTVNKTITFSTAPNAGSAIVAQYTYSVPVTAKTQDSTSISTYGLRSKEVLAPWISTTGDATHFGALYVSAYKDVKAKVTVNIPFLDVSIDSNNVVTLVNSIKNINGTYAIKSLKYEYPGTTQIDCGEFTFEQYELQKQIVNALHALMQITQADSSQFTQYKNLSETLTITGAITKKQVLSLAHYNDGSSGYSSSYVYSE